MPKFITRMTGYVLFLMFLPQPLVAEINASTRALEAQVTLLKQQQYISIAGNKITPATGLLPKFLPTAPVCSGLDRPKTG